MNRLHIATILILVNTLTNGEEPLIVAHRGASRDAPENTVPGFKLAWEQGTDAIEGDFRQTKDGHIVCIHDANTKRVSDRNLVVNQSSLKDLRELDVGSYRGEKYKGTVIPTIAEVFATVPDQKKIYIEIKSDESIIPNLLREIKNSGLKQNQIVVISFNENVIRKIKEKAPQYKAFWLADFKKNDAGKITPLLAAVLDTLRQIKADGFSSSKDIIDEAFIKSVINKGYEYHVWTVDDLETAKRFKDWGALSITTNGPGYMKKNLAGQMDALDAHSSHQ